MQDLQGSQSELWVDYGGESWKRCYEKDYLKGQEPTSEHLKYYNAMKQASKYRSKGICKIIVGRKMVTK